MKINITVGWCNTVQLEVDKARLSDPNYLDEIREQSVMRAYDNFNWKDGMVTNCDEVPEIVE